MQNDTPHQETIKPAWYEDRLLTELITRAFADDGVRRTEVETFYRAARGKYKEEVWGFNQKWHDAIYHMASLLHAIAVEEACDEAGIPGNLDDAWRAGGGKDHQFLEIQGTFVGVDSGIAKSCDRVHAQLVRLENAERLGGAA